MSGIKLKKRPCKIGVSINCRRQKHGDENVSALDIPISEIMLTKTELCELLDNPTAWQSLFDESGGTPTPTFGALIPTLSVEGKYDESTATIYTGMKPDKLELKDVKLTKLKLVPLDGGGITAMSLSISCTPEMGESVAKLLGYLDTKADIALKFGSLEETGDDEDEAQQKMDLAPDEVSTEARAH